MEKITIYKDQLSRMRSMNRYYHDQFLIDVRVLFVLNTIFIFLSLSNSNALYLLPLISLFGSVIPPTLVKTIFPSCRFSVKV